MAMQMQRAFNSRMLTKLFRYQVLEGSRNEFNEWVQGRVIKSKVFGVIKAGNKFSQFEEGEAVHTDDGGQRFSDYRTLYVTKKNAVNPGDKIGFKGKFYNVLQLSDEDEYGFWSYILEKSEDWKP